MENATTALSSIGGAQQHVQPEPGIVGGLLLLIFWGLGEIILPIASSKIALLVAAVFGLLQHLRRDHVDSPLLRHFGRSIFIFQIYYADWLHDLTKEKPFVLSLSALALDEILLHKLVQKDCLGVVQRFSDLRRLCLAHLVKKGLVQPLIEELAPARLELVDTDRHPIKNWYMSLSSPLRQPLLVFFAQLGLMLWYVWFLNIDPKSRDVRLMDPVKWALAVLVTAVAMQDGAGGSKYSHRFWTKLLPLNDGGRPAEFWTLDRRRNLSRPFFIGCRIPYYLEWRCRQRMDWLVNSMFRAVILSTAPIVLCVEWPMDFIKDCLALVFITSLDDYNDAQDVPRLIDECEVTGLPQELRDFLAEQLTPAASASRCISMDDPVVAFVDVHMEQP